MIVHILKRSLGIKKYRNNIIIFQGTISLILIITLLDMYSITLKKVQHLDTITGNLHKVTDNYIGNSERDFFSRADNVKVLKKFYNWETSNNNFTYIVVNKQNFYTDKNIFPSKFEVGYDVSHSTPDTYNSLQINNEFIKHFELAVEQGRLFNKQDFFYKNNVLPIVMGNEYLPYCKLGDKIKVYYLGKNFNCKIVGFLSKESYFNNGYDLESLDRYILMPSLEFNYKTENVDIIDQEQKKFELKLYLDKCSGFVYSKKSTSFLQNLITKKCYSLDIKPYTIEGFISFYPTMWGLEGKQFKELFIIFAIIMSIATILCISINMDAKIIALKRDYAIYIMNGISSKVISLSIILEIMYINFLSLLIASIFAFFLYGELPIILLILIYLILCITASIYPLIMLKKVNISKILRGDE